MITKEKIESIYQQILLGLDPSFASHVAGWREAVSACGVVPYVYCGRRTQDEQEELYNQGRTTAGKIVTNARGYPVAQSYHCYGMAIDWVPAKKVRENGYEADWDNIQHYGIGIENGKLFNMQALSWERPHLQNGLFKDWRDLARSDRLSPKQEPVVPVIDRPKPRTAKPFLSRNK